MTPAPSSPSPDTRFVFFAGKGGVGKTTCAAMAALSCGAPSGTGRRRAAPAVLAVSLDPAHSLRDVLGPDQKLPVLELDAHAEFQAFLDQHRSQLRNIANRGTYLDDEDVDRLLDMALPGLDEVMGLLKLGELAADPQYEQVIVDLPPTGHALRLFDVAATFDRLVQALDLMQGKHRFAVSSLTKRYLADAEDSFLEELQGRCERARASLFEQGGFTLVARPEPMVLAETVRLASQLQRLGARLVALIMNAAGGPLPPLPPLLRTPPLTVLPLLPKPPIGRDALCSLWESRGGGEAPPAIKATAGLTLPQERGHTLRTLIQQPKRLTIVAGKGGVGKTTIACAVALGLASAYPGRPVALASIDPAHSLADALQQPVGPQPVAVAGRANLRVVEPDARVSWQQFQQQWAGDGRELLQALPGGSHWDPVFDRQIAEALIGIQPPGIDELQAVTAIVDLLDENPEQFVVVDAAPTGHLLRFIEAPPLLGGWARQVMHLLLKYDLASRFRQLSEQLLDLTRTSKRLDGLLHDPHTCQLVLVTLPEPAVLIETQRLRQRLDELGIPIGWAVVNKRTGPESQAWQELSGLPTLSLPDFSEPPLGPEALDALIR